MIRAATRSGLQQDQGCNMIRAATRSGLQQDQGCNKIRAEARGVMNRALERADKSASANEHQGIRRVRARVATRDAEAELKLKRRHAAVSQV